AREDDLGEPVAVAEVGEDERAEVARGVHPALEDDFPADGVGAEFAAGVRAGAVLRVRRGREAGGRVGHGRAELASLKLEARPWARGGERKERSGKKGTARGAPVGR